MPVFPGLVIQGLNVIIKTASVTYFEGFMLYNILYKSMGVTTFNMVASVCLSVIACLYGLELLHGRS